MLQGSTTSCSLLDHDRHERVAAYWARDYGNKPGMARSSELWAPPIRRLAPAYPALASDAANAKWADPREEMGSAALVRIRSRSHEDLKTKSASRRAVCRTASISLIFSQDPGKAMPTRGNQAAPARRPHPSLCSSRIVLMVLVAAASRAQAEASPQNRDRNTSPLGSTPTWVAMRSSSPSS